GQLETGRVSVSRAARQAEFPACFQLIAAMNPCPCGYLGDGRRCKCTSEAVARYRSRLSGPLLDRLDLHIEAPRLAIETLSKRDSPEAEPSAAVARRVIAARTVQYARQGAANARLNNREVERYCQPTRAGLALLERASGALGLTARAF